MSSSSHRKTRSKRSNLTAAHDSPAAPDVISNLLASFSAISLPPDEPARDPRGPLLPVSAPRTPPRSIVPSNPAYQPYWSHVHVRQHDQPYADRSASLSYSHQASSHRRSSDNAYNEPHNPYTRPSDSADVLAAEPPAIRIARSSRSSAFQNPSNPSQRPTPPSSKPSSWRSRASLAFKSSEPTPIHSPPSLASPRNEYDRAYLHHAASAAQSANSSMRPSLDARRSPAPANPSALIPPVTPTSPQPAIKGKAKARAVSPVPEAQFEDALDVQPPPLQPPKSPRSWGFPSRPSTATTEAPSTTAAAPPSSVPSRPWRRRRDARRLQRQSSVDGPSNIVGDDTGFVVLHSPPPERNDSRIQSRIVSPGPSSTPSRAVSRDGPADEVPGRRSSLRHHRSPPSSTSRTRIRPDRPTSAPRAEDPKEPESVKFKDPAPPLQRPSSADTVNLDAEIGDLPAHAETIPPHPTAPPPAVPNNAVKTRQDHIEAELEEETDVTRRIRELKAANEKRRRDLDASIDAELASQSTTRAPPSARSITRNMEPQQPSTTLAAVQLQEAAKIKEKQILVPDADSRSFHEGRLGVPLMGAAASSKDARDSATFSRPSHDSARSGDALASPSLHSPGLSRASSKAKRWSYTNTSPKADSPARSHRRIDSRDRKLQYMAVAEEPPHARTSTDSIRDAVHDYLQSAQLSRTIPAPDDFSRQIAFSDIGDPQGHAVICCVGMGLTRYIMAYYQELAVSLGLRLITPDRPGIGDSSAYHDSNQTPLSWPDDVRAITRYLGISHFSLLAHSAGAVYAMATALRMPEKIRGRVHLLAPWIPPSQMTVVGLPSSNTTPSKSLPRSQRFLRMLPASFLRFGSSSNIMGRANAVGNTAAPRPKTPSKRDKRPSELVSPRRSTSVRSPGMTASPSMLNSLRPSARGSARASGRNSPDRMYGSPNLDDIMEGGHLGAAFAGDDELYAAPTPRRAASVDPHSRQQRYDEALTPAVWELATRNANAAVDLLVCLERTRQIGFRYADVTQRVVIHHGTKDTRVPLENVKWISQTMRAAEVRVLEGEGHGLMASAGVMSQVLVEMSKEKDERVAGSMELDDLDFR